MANGKEITRDEILALRASAQVVIEQADKLLAKIDDKEAKMKKSNISDLDVARVYARRMKNFCK